MAIQDLPNYAQHTVPIFSLPQEWLWCESWCGNATKARAKTIDLCNNPMTKEPKLQVRNVPTLNFPGPTLYSFIKTFIAHRELRGLLPSGLIWMRRPDL